MYGPEEIKRDQDGHYLHSAIADLEEDTFISKHPASEGMEYKFLAFEDDASEEVIKQYFDAGGPDLSSWNPTPPTGEGWFLVAIYDTEDGPSSAFARPKR